MIVSTAIQKMIAFYKGNHHDINHFLKVWSMAKTIGELEGLDGHTQEVLELTAVVHDIACPLCREKYGDADGKHHHTYTEIGGIDHQILLEADYLVNADEHGYSRPAIQTFRQRIFRTAAGLRLLDSIYLQDEHGA